VKQGQIFLFREIENVFADIFRPFGNKIPFAVFQFLVALHSFNSAEQTAVNGLFEFGIHNYFVAYSVLQVFGRVVGYNLSFINNDNPVRYRLHFLHNVWRENYGFVFSELFDEGTNLYQLIRVKSGSWFVKN